MKTLTNTKSDFMPVSVVSTMIYDTALSGTVKTNLILVDNQHPKHPINYFEKMLTCPFFLSSLYSPSYIPSAPHQTAFPCREPKRHSPS